MQLQDRQTYSPDEYLAQEELAEFRSEYRDGEIVPMTGGSLNHNRILGALYAHLRFSLRGKGAEPFASDVRLWIPEYRQYTYPDLMVIQGAPIYHLERTDTITNPVVIVEVLSESTRDYDGSTKFKFYRSIPSLQEYVMIDQYQVGIEQYTKTEGKSWLFRDYGAEDKVLVLSSLGLEVAIADLYEGVDFQVTGNE